MIKAKITYKDGTEEILNNVETNNSASKGSFLTYDEYEENKVRVAKTFRIPKVLIKKIEETRIR